MGVEIERKFLVSGIPWNESSPVSDIMQGYLDSTGAASVRIRVLDGRGVLTIKSKDAALERREFEYSIPEQDAHEMLEHLAGGRLIAKRRHSVMHAGREWAVDEFTGALAGLVVAEIELSSSDDDVALPAWVRQEVTGNPKYLNSELALRSASQSSAEI